jgi:ketosteroid isomerase-like protein
MPDIIEEGLRRLSARDLDSWLELFTEDARLHDLPELPDSEVFEGHDGLRRWAQNNIELSERWNWRPVDCLAQRGGLVVTETALDARGAKSDVSLNLVVFHAVRLERGKIASVQAFSTRDQAFEAAGLQDPDG